MIQFHEQDALVSVDVDATRRLYSLIDHGETEDCDCGNCGYFAEHRAEAYTPQFRALLERLGIDATKENETWSVPESKWCLFHGDFDFVGTVKLDALPEAQKGRPAPAYDALDYGFHPAGYSRTEERSIDLGFEPIAGVWFTLWLPVPINGIPTPARDMFPEADADTARVMTHIFGVRRGGPSASS